MTPKRKKRLYLVLFILIATASAVGLTTYALQQNINLFYSPLQIAGGEAPSDTRIRAGGMVVDGSIKRAQNSLKVSFDITDYQETVTVTYDGILPDLFREGQGIVAQGELNSEGIFVADEVLAKHDEQYMPPEVEEALKNASEAHKGYGESTQ